MDLVMKTLPKSAVLHTVGQVLFNLLLLTFGSILCATSLSGILIPNGFLGSGLAGLVLIRHYLFSPWDGNLWGDDFSFTAWLAQLFSWCAGNFIARQE